MNIRNLALGSVASLALFAGSAFAADLPVRGPAPAPVYAAPVLLWSGFYVGAAIGGVNSEVGSNFNVPEYNYLLGNNGNDLNQFTAGGYLGYNFQFGNFVAGLEGDLNARFGRGSNGGAFLGPYSVGGGVESDWDASIRLRLGFLVTPRALIYATGGVAFTDYSAGKNGYAVLCEGNPECNAQYGWLTNMGGNRTGWTLGAGIEYALDANWHLKVEYLYADYGSDTFRAPVITEGPVLSRSVDVTSNTVRVGLSYRFGGASAAPVVARY